jgi:hypothetical protein
MTLSELGWTRSGRQLCPFCGRLSAHLSWYDHGDPETIQYYCHGDCEVRMFEVQPSGSGVECVAVGHNYVHRAGMLSEDKVREMQAAART